MSLLLEARVILFGNTLAGWTAINPIIPANELVLETGGAAIKGKLGDGTTPYLSLPYSIVAGGGVGTQSLQSVLNIGNVANQVGGNIAEIDLQDAASVTKFKAAPNNLVVGDAAGINLSYNSTGGLVIANGATILAVLNTPTGIPVLSLKDSLSAFYANVKAGALTATRTYLYPNEGAGAGLADTLVLHNTKNDINVGDIAARYINIGASGDLVLSLAGVIQAALTQSSGIPVLSLKDSLSAFYATLKAGALTATRFPQLPDKSGLLLVATPSSAPVSTGALVGASSVVISHGLPFTPSFVNLIPVAGADSTAFNRGWVDTFTGTNFTINFSSPQTGTFGYNFVAYP